MHEVTPPRDSADRVDSIISPTSAPVPAAAGPCPSEYLLVCTASSLHLNHGSWHFSLESVDGQSVLEAGDEEGGDLNRLTLLAAVRGLESIDGPSGVTLLSHNRYLIRSLSDSLPRWRQNDFSWEHFGSRIDVQHCDLWRRVDRALAIHRVEACLVSSRLVSPGVVPPMLDRSASPGTEASRGIEASQITEAKDAPQWRVDGAHPTPKDNLRRWLLASATSNATRGGGRRFTAADLAESA